MRYFLSLPGMMGGNSKGNPGKRWEFWKDWESGPTGLLTPITSGGGGAKFCAGWTTELSSNERSVTALPADISVSKEMTEKYRIVLWSRSGKSRVNKPFGCHGDV